MTYVPAAARTRRTVDRASASAPVAAVLASALLAGGTVHALGSADSPVPAAAETKPTKPKAQAREALPLLALASTDVKPIAAPVVAEAAPVPAKPLAAPVAAEPRPPMARPVAALAAAEDPPSAPQPTPRPRRDLAGFLDDQGLSITPASDIAIAAPAPVEAVVAASEQPVAPAPAPIALADANGAAPADNAEAQTFPTVSLDGIALGAVTMRGDTVHLGSLVGLLQLKMPPEEFARLKTAPAADSFVGIDTLRAAGLAIAIDSAGERLTLAAL